MLDFNKIVNKLLKKWWNIIFKEDIFDMIDPEQKEKYQSYLDKTIYRLKAEKIIIPIKSWVYIIPESWDFELNEIDLLEKYYLKLLKKYISHYVGNSYFISGKKSLELQLKDYSVPEKISIINRSLNKKIKVGNYEIIFKTISWNLEGKKINLYAKLSSFTDTLSIENSEFKVASLELALLEASIVSIGEVWVDIFLLNKAIKKYAKVFKKETFRELWKYKFIMAFNRLKELSKNIDKDLYELFLDIIKQNGGLFIGEGLRGF
jgi:hypothetical protein